jgi:hypothetical protein
VTARVWDVLGSWWLTAALLAAGAGLFAYASTGDDGFALWSRLLLDTPAGLAGLALLVANLVAASVRTIIERKVIAPASEGGIRAMDSWVALPASADADDPFAVVREWMRGLGFSPEAAPGGIVARRGKLSYIPGTVLRAGIVVMIVALVLSARLRQEGGVSLVAGESGAALGLSLRAVSIDPGLPAEFLQVGDSAIFRVPRASVTVEAGDRTMAIASGYPTRSNGLYLKLSHEGFRARMTLRAGGRTHTGAPLLDLLPPGRSDEFGLGGAAPYSVSLEPERTMSKGLLTGKLFDLARPRLKVVPKGGGEEAIVRAGEEAALGGGTLSLDAAEPYAHVLVVRDPALPALYCGVALTLLGLLLMATRLAWYERTMRACIEGGTVFVGYDEEFYRKWGVYKFRAWSEKLPKRGADGPQAGERMRP